MGKKVKQMLDGGPGLIVQFSKCDFWNLGDFLNRNMWSKTFWSKKIDRKKFRNIFFETKTFSYEKVNEKWKFWNFDFFDEKVEKNEISKFSFFIDFFIGFFLEYFVVSKNIFRCLSEKNSSRKNISRKNNFYYSDPKFSQESKNHT